jgi:alpha-1,3-rhamnosyl/mannosyltransferase
VGRVYENLLAAFAGNADVGEIHTIVPALHKERFLEQFSHPTIVPTFVWYGPMGAMAAGVPVVCSDIPVFREVYGDAVLYVDPYRAESIAEGVRTVLRDTGLSARFALHGRARAELYRRDRSLNAYLDLIRST